MDIEKVLIFARKQAAVLPEPSKAEIINCLHGFVEMIASSEYDYLLNRIADVNTIREVRCLDEAIKLIKNNSSK